MPDFQALSTIVASDPQLFPGLYSWIDNSKWYKVQNMRTRRDCAWPLPFTPHVDYSRPENKLHVFPVRYVDAEVATA